MILRYIIPCCLSFLAGAALITRSSDPKQALPVVCMESAPMSPPGLGSDPSRCWDGMRFRYLMPGYQRVAMEGGAYLVGWPK